MGLIKDTKSFIAAGKARFGSQYDYRDAAYVNASTKIRLYCTLHDTPVAVDVTSQVHLGKKGGCKRCKAEAAKARHTKTIEQFIAEAKAIHQDRFSYDSVQYVNARTAVEIHCNKHNEDFSQIPDVHLRGSSGCKKCKSEAISATNAPLYAARRVPFSEFIARAKALHGDRYIYDASSYTSLSDDVTIECRVHGAFPQRASHHVDGAGCKYCAVDELRITREAWRARIRDKFPDIQIRILEIWKGFDTQVKAKCLRHPHGTPWTLTARALQQGNGCRTCERERKNAPRLRKLLLKHPDLPEELRAATNPLFLLFAAKATEKYHGKYRYQEASFQYYSRPCTAICPQHDEFKIHPKNHLRGLGCPLCDQKEKFISRSTKDVEGRYEYSKVEFSEPSMEQHITLRCLLHDVWFSQQAQSHLEGRKKCPICVKHREETALDERRQARIPALLKAFSKKARKIHSNTFDYPALKSELYGWTSRITIICRKHGRKSSPTAAEHLGHYSGRPPMGCQACKGEKSRLRLRKDFQAVTRSLADAGFTLLVDESRYVNMRAKVRMRCVDGHENDLVPQKIVAGYSCPDCPSYVGEAVCRSILGDLFGTQFKKRWFTQKDYPDLVAPYHHLEVDGYSQASAVAFEYQGVYHRLRKVHRTPDAYEKQLERDRITGKICDALDISLIVIDEFSYPLNAEDVRDKINKALEKANIDEKFQISEPLDLRKHLPIINRSGLKQLHELAKKQNLLALDKQWFGAWHTYNWQCKACDRTFRSPYAVRKSAKHACCPACARSLHTVKTQARKTRLERFAEAYLANLRQRATDLGLMLLDSEWKGSASEHQYHFRCVFTEGPVITRVYNNLQKFEPGCDCQKHRQLRKARLSGAP